MKLVSNDVPGLSNAWIEAALYFDALYQSEERGQYSTTQLIMPVRHVFLNRRHDDEITLDITDRANLLVGSAGHAALAAAAPDDAMTEERFTINVLGIEIGIKPDRVDLIPNTDPPEYLNIDFKFASVWSVILGDKDEWTNQGIINSYALRSIGINVTQAQAEIKLTDWALRDAIKDTSYPPKCLAVVPIKLLGDLSALVYLEERVKLFLDNEDVADDELPLCSHKERWAKDDVFAVMKRGAKRATKVCTSKAEATDYMNAKGYGPEYESIFRPGESTRCIRFCPANRWCSQYRAERNNKQ